SNAFKKDPNIVTESASSADYRKSGYDRGHLAPAADMKWSVQAMNESFYYSNICPQLPTLNRGVWKDIEEKVRHWVQIYDTVYVITGPVLHKELPTIVKNKVAVPEKFYKVLLLYSSTVQDAVGFIVPNITNLDNDIHKYLVPVDSVETVTNILFFTQISESVRKKIKKNSSIAHWN